MNKKDLAPTKIEGSLQQLIVFRVSDEEFGVQIESVQEIIKVGFITPIPDSPAFIQGLINVRGDIVAVINLKQRLALNTAENAAKHIVIAKQDGSVFGVMVDEVIEILRIQTADMKAPPRLMSKIHEEYVRGVITHEGRLIIILDFSKILSEVELTRLAEAAHVSLREKEMAEATLKFSQQEEKRRPSGPNKALETSQARPKKGREGKKKEHPH